MKRGPKPKPTAKRRLEGNPGRRPYNIEEPVMPTADASFDDVPTVLQGDLVAADEWRRLAPLLRRARIVTDADRNALIAACQQWSIYQDSLVRAPAERRVLRTPNDYPIPNPYIPMASKALLHCERLWESLGLTPSSRSRVVAAAAAADNDPFAEFDGPRVGPTFKGRRYADDDDATTTH